MYELNDEPIPSCYWEQNTIKETPKKKVSFDDILTNMNLVVNKQGVLQFMVPTNTETTHDTYTYASPASFPPPIQQPTTQPPIDNSVKHSYIFNKYFKDYSDKIPNQIEEIRIPKTIEEYKRMVLEDAIKKLNYRKMIDQIKPKQILFTTPEATVSRPVIRPSVNKLRTMHFM